MKRVVAFFDMFDEIPDNAKYLFSIKTETPIESVDNTKSPEIVTNNPEAQTASKAIIHIHYYEVDGMDFEELMISEFPRKNNLEKMKEFFQLHKISMK